MHCIQHQGSAKGWGLQTTTAFMEKIQAGGACLHPRQGVLEQSQFKGRGERGFAHKGVQSPHPAAGASGNPDCWESSQLPSSREEAAAHRSQQVRKGRV